MDRRMTMTKMVAIVTLLATLAVPATGLQVAAPASASPQLTEQDATALYILRLEAENATLRYGRKIDEVSARHPGFKLAQAGNVWVYVPVEATPQEVKK